MPKQEPNLDDLTYDGDELEAATFEPVSIGRHHFKVTDARAEISQSKGNPMIALEVDVAEGGEEDGRRCFEYWNWNPDGMKYIKGKLPAFGLDPEVKGVTIKEMAAELIGCEADGLVKRETYQGEARAKIARWIVPDDST